MISTSVDMYGVTTITFRFLKPILENDVVGGYDLYQSYNNVDFTKVFTRIDYEHYGNGEEYYTYDIDEYTYFEYECDKETTDGCSLYYRLECVSTLGYVVSDSASVNVHTCPSEVPSVFAKYDGNTIEVSWEPISFESGVNSDFSGYEVRRYYLRPIADAVLQDGVLYSDSFDQFKMLFIIDTSRRSQWFGVPTSTGIFDLDSHKIDEICDVYTDYDIQLRNLLIYELEDTYEVLTQTAETSYIDTTFTIGYYYVYSVLARNTGGGASNETFYPITTVNIEETSPYIRSVGNSSTGILAQQPWKKIKNALIDKNYYDKESFAIPYSLTETYNLKGYLGIANCYVDIFVNEIYYMTTSTGDFGEFDINYQFPKGETTLYVLAREKTFNRSTIKSNTLRVRTLYIYTWFAAVGNEYQNIKDELDAQKLDLGISTVRAASLEERYLPLIGIYKDGLEEDDVFRNIVTTVFQAYEYVGYNKSLEDVLDILVDNIPEFDHYEIYYRNFLYDTIKTGKSYIHTDMNLDRAVYYYGVSSIGADGEETPPTLVTVDSRWWPLDYKGMNVIKWNITNNARSYNVYRGIDTENILFLKNVNTNFFVDYGVLSPTGQTPQLYNYTNITKPSGVSVDTEIHLANLFMKLKKATSLTIILFENEDDMIPDFQMNRLLFLLTKIIPPELYCTLIRANNSRVEILT